MAKIVKLESLKNILEAEEKFYTFKKGNKWYVATKVDGKRVAKLLDKNNPNRGVAQKWCDSLNRDYKRHGETILDNFLNYEADEEI